jgi:hypothetical protein
MSRWRPCGASRATERPGLPLPSLVLLPDDISRLHHDLGVRFVIVDGLARPAPRLRGKASRCRGDGLRNWYRVVGEHHYLDVTEVPVVFNRSGPSAVLRPGG